MQGSEKETTVVPFETTAGVLTSILSLVSAKKSLFGSLTSPKQKDGWMVYGLQPSEPPQKSATKRKRYISRPKRYARSSRSVRMLLYRLIVGHHQPETLVILSQ